MKLRTDVFRVSNNSAGILECVHQVNSEIVDGFETSESYFSDGSVVI